MLLINSLLLICLLIISSNAQSFENIPSTSYNIPGGHVDASRYHYNIPSNGQKSTNVHSSLIYSPLAHSSSSSSRAISRSIDYSGPLTFREYQAHNTVNYPISSYDRISSSFTFTHPIRNNNNYQLVNPKLFEQNKPSENLFHTSTTNNFNQPINMDNMMKELYDLQRSSGFTYMVPENMDTYKKYMDATNGFGSALNIKNANIIPPKYISAPNYSPNSLYSFSTQHMANRPTPNKI